MQKGRARSPNHKPAAAAAATQSAADASGCRGQPLASHRPPGGRVMSPRSRGATRSSGRPVVDSHAVRHSSLGRETPRPARSFRRTAGRARRRCPRAVEGIAEVSRRDCAAVRDACPRRPRPGHWCQRRRSSASSSAASCSSRTSSPITIDTRAPARSTSSPTAIDTRFRHEDGSVDGILCWDVFDFLPKAAAQALARQIVRMLRPGRLGHGVLLQLRVAGTSRPSRSTKSPTTSRCVTASIRAAAASKHVLAQPRHHQDVRRSRGRRFVPAEKQYPGDPAQAQELGGPCVRSSLF